VLPPIHPRRFPTFLDDSGVRRGKRSYPLSIEPARIAIPGNDGSALSMFSTYHSQVSTTIYESCNRVAYRITCADGQNTKPTRISPRTKFGYEIDPITSRSSRRFLEMQPWTDGMGIANTREQILMTHQINIGETSISFVAMCFVVTIHKFDPDRRS